MPLGISRGEESLIGSRVTRPLRAVLRTPLSEPTAQALERESPSMGPATAPDPVGPDATGAIAAIGPTKPAHEASAEPAAAVPAVRAAEPTTGVVPLADDYLEAKDLSELPRPLSDPRLAELERLVSSAGEVRMVLFIDESGRVVAIDVRSATLPTTAVARAAEIFSDVPFSPGRVGSMAVKSRIGITVGAARRGSYGN